MKKNESQFYSLERILETNSHYNMIIGERSNGKTFSVQEYMLRKYLDHGEQGAVIRRYDIDFIGRRGQECFSALCDNTRGNLVEKYSNGKWTGITFYSMRWYLSKRNEKGYLIKDAKPFAYAFNLGAQEHDKSTSYNGVTTILFDEFLTRDYYLNNEFILFQNVLSTIIRLRDNVKIFMCGNTVNFYSPYFTEMGIGDIKDLKKGDLKVYKFAVLETNEVLQVALEFSDFKGKKASNIYFAFGNEKLKMITQGIWEVAIYPHCPCKYERKDILLTYFIQWQEDTLQCEIVQIDDSVFTYIHKKTTPIKKETEDIVFSSEFMPNPNWSRKILKTKTDYERKIKWFYDNDKVFYQDNQVGEIVRNYLNWCKTDRGFV